MNQQYAENGLEELWHIEHGTRHIGHARRRQYRPSITKDSDMGRTTKDTGSGDFKQAPEGTHVARCIGIVDIGTHHGEYQGQPTVRNQIIVRWELPYETETFEDKEAPLIVSKFYTNSLSEKANLRKDLQAWRSREFTPEELMGFDLMNILGKPCTVSIVHNEKGKAKVVSVAAVPKGTQCPPAVNAVDAFWIDEWDDNKFAALPEGFKKMIAESDEYKAFKGDSPVAKPTANGSDADDDIPF